MLKEFFDSDGQFNSAHWVLLSSWSTWVMVAIFLMVIALCWMSWLNTRQLAPRRRWILFGLRGLTIFIVSLLFVQPGVRLEDRDVVRNHIAVLMDHSRSMSLPGVSDGSRLDALKAFLKSNKPTLDVWREPHQIDLFTFDRHVKSCDDVEAVKAQGDATDLTSVLEEIASRYTKGDLAAVILVSDGADTGSMSKVTDVSEIPKAVRSTLKRLGAPLHTVFTGPDSAPPDIAVSKLAYDDFAFVRNAVTIDAEVTVSGYENVSVPVVLTRDGKEIGRRILQAIPGKRVYAFSFDFVPDETGKAAFTFQVNPAPGEKVKLNNRRDFVIRVIRDKIRVLQVVGRPSWDQRFLRKLLKKNPNVDLISFFILRTSSSLSPSRRDEMSLIPFPTKELFEEQLGSFDLIIFQNFTYRGYRMRQYLPLIRNYVRNGGGFVMLGGDISFAEGGYGDTAIAEFLPIMMGNAAPKSVLKERFRPTLTPVGRYHPITLLNSSPEENQASWAGLPKLSGLNGTAGLHPDATALLAHDTLKSNGQPTPVVAVRNYGKGRVLSILTDSTWRWDFQSFGQDSDNRNYYKFWGNAIRWLIRDPELKRVRVTTDKDRYSTGSTVSALVRLSGDNYRPAVNANVTVRAQLRSNTENTTGKVTKISGVTDQAGQFTARFEVVKDGAWDVEVVADDEVKIRDTDAFVVSTNPIELTSTAPNKELLRALAKVGGGTAIGITDNIDELARIKPRMLQVNRRKDVPIWANGWLLLLGILVPSMEWFFRRRWGLA
jgi:uncharacterized membrane protein